MTRALLTRMSTLSYAASTRSLRLATLRSLATSVWTNRASPPSSRISCSVAAPVARSISAMTTFAPSQARARASSCPIPLPAPVTTATLPAKLRWFKSIRSRKSIRITASPIDCSSVHQPMSCSKLHRNVSTPNSVMDAMASDGVFVRHNGDVDRKSANTPGSKSAPTSDELGSWLVYEHKRISRFADETYVASFL